MNAAEQNRETSAHHVVEMEVPFHDCDPLFVVWHGRYFEYFEVARCALLKKLGLDIPEVRALGYRMYVTDARCRFMFPISYGHRVSVRAALSATSPLIRISYDLRNLTEKRRSARGHTVLATTDAEGRLLTETPRPLLARLHSFRQSDPLRGIPKNTPGDNR